MGAAPTRIYHLARLLKREGYRVTVICGLPNYPVGKIFPEYRGKVICTEEDEGIVVKRIWLYPSNSRQPARRLFSMLSHSLSLWSLALPALLRDKPDLFIVSSPPLFMALSGTMIGKLCGRPVLLNISDIYPSTAYDLGLLKKNRAYRWLEFLEQRMYRNAQGIMGQSEEILEHVSSRIRRKVPTFLYRNLQPSTPDTSAPAAGTVRRVVYAGILGPVQGVLELCRSVDFAALNLELHLYGEGPDRPLLKEWLATAPGKGIVLHDPLPMARMQELLPQYHAALVPLRKYIRGAVPSKLYAALAAGIPVLFSGMGEGAGIIRNGGLGWVNEGGDYAALTDNLRQLAALSDDAYLQLRQHCRKEAGEAFHKDRQDHSFLSFLRRLLPGQSS